MFDFFFHFIPASARPANSLIDRAAPVDETPDAAAAAAAPAAAAAATAAVDAAAVDGAGVDADRSRLRARQEALARASSVESAWQSAASRAAVSLSRRNIADLDAFDAVAAPPTTPSLSANQRRHTEVGSQFF